MAEPKPTPAPAIGGFSITKGPDGKSIYTPTPAANRTVLRGVQDPYGSTKYVSETVDPTTGASTRGAEQHQALGAGTEKGQAPYQAPAPLQYTPEQTKQLLDYHRQMDAHQQKVKEYERAGTSMDAYAKSVTDWQARMKAYDDAMTAAKALPDPRGFNERIHAPGNKPADRGRHAANAVYRNTLGLFSANMEPKVFENVPVRAQESDPDGLRADQRAHLEGLGFAGGRPQMPKPMTQVLMPGVTGYMDPSRRGNEYHTAEAFTPEQQKEFGTWLNKAQTDGRMKHMGLDDKGKAKYQLPEELGGGEFVWDGAGPGPNDHHALAGSVMRRYAQGYGWQDTKNYGAVDAIRPATSPIELFLPGAGLQTLVRAGMGRMAATNVARMATPKIVPPTLVPKALPGAAPVAAAKPALTDAATAAGSTAAKTEASAAGALKPPAAPSGPVPPAPAPPPGYVPPAPGAAPKPTPPAPGGAPPAGGVPPKPPGTPPAPGSGPVPPGGVPPKPPGPVPPAGGTPKPAPPAPGAPAPTPPVPAPPPGAVLPGAPAVAPSGINAASRSLLFSGKYNPLRLLAGPQGGALTPTYALEAQLAKILPTWAQKGVSMAMSPLRMVTGEGALRNMATGGGLAKLRAGVYGLGGASLPFLGSAAGGHSEGNARINDRMDFIAKNEFSKDPQVLASVDAARKEIDAIKGQQGFVRSGDPKMLGLSHLVPGAFLPTSGYTTMRDLISGKPKRNQESPTILDDWDQRWKGMKSLGSNVGRAAVEGDPLASQRLKDTVTRVVPNTASDIVGAYQEGTGGDANAKLELAKLEPQIHALEDQIEALPPGDPQRAQLEETLSAAKAKAAPFQAGLDTRGAGAVRTHMALTDEIAQGQKQLAALQADPNKQLEAQQLQKDLAAKQKQLGRLGLTPRDTEAVDAHRKTLEIARGVLADGNAAPITKLEARRTLEGMGINPDQPDGPVMGWQKDPKGTREFDQATGTFKNKPQLPDPQGPQPFGAAAPPWGDDDEAALAATVEKATLSGDFASAQKGYEEYVNRVGGDPRKVPLAMVPDVTHEHFKGMDAAKFGAMIDGDKPGLYAGYTKGQEELRALGQQLDQAGPNAPPALKAAYEAKYNQLQQQRVEVQGRALTHYQNQVIDPMIKTEVPQFQAQVQQLQAKLKSGQPLSPQDLAAAQQLQAQGQEMTDTFTRFAMKQASVSGARTIDGKPIASVADFVREAGNEKSPIGGQIKARIDGELLDLIPGRKYVDEYGRPQTESLVDPNIGKSIFGKLDPTSKMLLYAGLGLGAIGLLGGMMGFGGPIMPILGMLGLGLGAYGVTGGQFSKLTEKSFWGEMLGGLKGPDKDHVQKQTLEQLAQHTDPTTGRPVMGSVSLANLQNHPSFQKLVEGKLPAEQAVQTIAMLKPEDRAALAQSMAGRPGAAEVGRMVTQVNMFDEQRQQAVKADAQVQQALATPAGQSAAGQAKSLTEFYGTFGIKGASPDQVNAQLMDRLGRMDDRQLGQMVTLMPPPVRAEAVAGLQAKVKSVKGGWVDIKKAASLSDPIPGIVSGQEIAQAKQALRLGRLFGIPEAR